MSSVYVNNNYTAKMKISSRRIDYKRIKQQLNRDKHNTTGQYLNRLKKKDKELVTYNHSIKVGKLSRAFAEYLDCDSSYCDVIETAGKLHDVGKLKIPTEILTKPTRLTEQEFSIIKRHSVIGYHMLKDAGYPRIVYEVAGGHHMSCVSEKGYGYGPSCEPVPFHCKIVMCCDIFEAIVAKRHYKDSMEIDSAIEVFRKEERVDPVMKCGFICFIDENRREIESILKEKGA